MKVLVCDGDGSSRAVVRRLLVLSHGCEVTDCVNGAEALDALAAGAFDVVLLETDLQVLDGFETLALIRESPELKHLPVIMLTSNRTEEAVQRAIDLGVSDYILKPLRMHRLQAGLRALLAHSQAATRTAGSAASQALTIDANARVMVVDGDHDFREFFAGLLAPYCTVLQAPTGASALAAAWVSGPSIVFVGRHLGPVSAPALVRHLSRMGTGRFIRLASTEEVTPEDAAMFDHVIGRTLVPAVMLRELKRFIAQGSGPMQRLLEHVPDLRHILISATASTFGMMLGQEIDVVETDGADVIGAHALVDLVVAETTRVRFEIQCGSELTRQLASATLGDDVDARTAVGVLGEMANVVTGRLQATLLDRGVTCLCSLPAFGVGRSPDAPRSDAAERLIVELSPSGTARRFRLVLDVDDVPVEASDVAGDESLTA